MPEKMVENEFENWNPMVEDDGDPSFNKYIDGPGAEMDEKLQPANIKKSPIQQFRTQIYVRNIPDGLNENGIRNLFLSAGEATSIFLHPNNIYAIVEFKSQWAAELAIRDRNEAPPYYLKVSFKKTKESESSPCTEQSNNTNTDDDAWDLKPVYVPKLKRDNVEKINHGSKLFKELFGKKSEYPSMLDYKGDHRFYQFNGDDYNPSIGCYQIYGDCFFTFPSISKGRCFYEMGVDEFVDDEKLFKAGTGNNKSCAIRKCFQCCSDTIKKCQVCNTSFCSTECLNSSSHFKTCVERNEKKDGSEKTEWEYVVPEALKFEKPDIDLGPSVFENFTLDTSGIIKLTYGHNKIHFGSVMLKDGSDDFVKIIELKTFKESLEFAKVGQLVLVPDAEDMARRGIILSKGEYYYRVALIDTAEVVSVKNVYEAPDEALDVVNFGATIIITEEINTNLIKNLPEKGGRFLFEVTGPCKSNQWPCTLKNTLTKKPVAKALLSKWIPRRDLECVELKNGSRVVMTMYLSTNVVYIRPDDEIWGEKFVLLTNAVAVCAMKSKPIKEPVLGEMYCARLKEDKRFYRGVVLATNGDDVKVAFVDFGNEQEVKVGDLRPLPEALKRVPCFAVKVVLKWVPKLASGLAIKYLNELICENEILELKFIESISNQVELISKEGENVNRALARDIMPSWMKDKNYKSLLAQAINEKKLRLLKLNQGKQDLFLLHFDPEDFSSDGVFWATLTLTDLIGLVYGELKDKLEEYCESFGPESAYLPRKDEVCCALYEGEWLRGICKGTEKTSCSIFFVDYGYKGIVETIGIRRMREEFLEVPALAVPCIVNNSEKWKDKPDLKKQVQNYMKDQIETKLKDVNVLKLEGGGYIVSIDYIERSIRASEIESSKFFDLLKSTPL